jgi:hypothetical protein
MGGSQGLKEDGNGEKNLREERKEKTVKRSLFFLGLPP